MNVFENIHRLLATACEQHEIRVAKLRRYHQCLRDILAKYEGGRLPDAAYHEAEILNNKIKRRLSALMERDPPGPSLPEQALGAH